MLPASGSISRISSRAVVDLPQPLSPTMPSVSPLRTLKLTPSTARTVATVAPNSPPRMGKCFLRPESSSSGWAGPPRSTKEEVLDMGW